MTSIDFEVTWSKVKVKLRVFEKMLSAKYLLTLLLGSGKVGTVDAPRE